MFKFKTLLGAFICGVLTLGTGIGLNVAANNGALENAKAVTTESPYVYEFLSKGDFVDNASNSINLGGIDWNYDNSLYYYQGGKGLQIGSSGTPTENWNLTTSVTNFDGSIFKVVIESSIASKGDGKLSLFSDGTQSEIFNLTTTNEPYTFDFSTSPTTELKINLSATKKAMYIKSIEVYFSKGDVGTLDSLTYTGEVAKQYENKPFDSTGLTFTANYTNDSMEVPLNNITFTPEILTKDTKEVVASYETVICKIPVVVGSLDKLTYEGSVAEQFVGQKFDHTGLTFYANYTNESSLPVAIEEITFTPNFITEDTEAVTATYETFSCNITGFVINKVDVLRKVNNLSEIIDGDFITFAYNDKVLMGKNSGKFFVSEEVAKNSDGSFNNGPKLEIFSVVKTSDGYYFVNGEGSYLEYHGDSNDVYLSKELTNECKWNIKLSGDGLFEITNVAAPERVLQYNTSSPKFSWVPL